MQTLRMKRVLLGLSLIALIAFSSGEVKAQNSCTHESTQARVQNNISTPWSSEINVGCDRKFNVGSFHNNSGQFANDTWLYVYGPGNFGAYFKNGQTVEVSQNGTYYLNVTTGENTSRKCSDSAVVNVVCPASTPTPQHTNACPYGSTQARVQRNIDDPWKQQMDLSCGDKFNVGSFHDGTGQFATDTKLRVEGPRVLFVTRLNHDFSNGQSIRAWFPGKYTLFVTTEGKRGSACEQKATVNVTCSRFWWQ